MSTRSSRLGMVAGALVSMSTGACADERPDVVNKTIGPAGGLISSHDDVLTLVFQPGALRRDYEIEIFPSDLPPLIFGPAYRVKPDVELDVDVEVTYRRVLPSNTDGVAVAAIRLDDYTEQMGHWQSLPRLSIDEASGAVLASDHELSLYYGMLESGGSSSGTSGPTSGNPTDPTDPTNPTDPTDPTDPTGSTSDGTESSTDPTDPTTATTDGPGGCGDGSIDPAQQCFVMMDFAMGGGPVDVALADFNNDNDLDVATANSDGTYSVRLGDGTGGFGAETNTPAGMAATAIAAGDFDQANGDDLVVLLGNENQFLLLQSQGNGSFNENPIVLGGMNSSEVMVTDGNADGVPDIFIANAGSNNVSFFPFMGGLGGEQQYDAGMAAGPMGLSFGQYDLNTNMNGDVFVFGGGNFAALPGNGAGFADAPIGGTIGMDLRRAIGGELGGTAAGDAAVTDFAQGGVHVLIGNGDAGGFSSENFYDTGAGALDVAAADMTGDGDIDLVVANSGADTITLLEKTGDQSWGNATDYDVVGGPSGIGAGDLNGDGVDDIVVAGLTGNAITVLVSDP